ncbi:MAG: TonB-dependent receptor domain-containing protein, partial [Candidatus Dormibacteraceae bacterium]
HKGQDLTQFEIDDNLTWVKGKHTFKFGFKGRQEHNNVEELQQAQGSEFFSSNWTGLYDPAAQGITPFTGSGLASLELGLPGYLSNQYNRGFFYFQQKEVGFFGEDTWRLTPKLTVSLGLRWEFWTPYKEKYNRLDNIDLNSLSPTSMQVVFPHGTTLGSLGLPSGVVDSWTARGLTSVSANSIGFPGALTPNVWNDFSPHLAVAYRLSDKWVIRGGYGTYFFPMPLSQILQTMRINPPLNLRYQNNVDSQQGNNGNYSLMVVPAASDTLGSGGTATVSPAGVDQSAQSFLAMDVHHWANDKVQEWTATVERELQRNMVLKLSYTGNHGGNLQQHWDYNAPVSKYNYQASTGLAAPVLAYQRQLDPNWTLTGSDGVLEHNGYSNSHSIQAVLDKRFSSGLSFQIYYAYTHAMATNDSGGFSSGGGSINASATGLASQGGGTSGTVPANSEILGSPNLTNSQRLRLLYTNSSQVPPQRLTWTGIYQLPFGKGKKFLGGSGRAMDALVGGWQVGFIGTWDGGFWMGVNPGEYLFGNPSLDPGNHM